MARKFYITTTLPYVNADPHIGFAWELVQADVIARYHKLLGEEVFFNTGTDEHGLKIYRKALEEKKDPQTYVDEYATKFKNLQQALNLCDDLHFIRTTDTNHILATQEFWRRCEKADDIYKGFYKIRYCVGCELEKTDSELIDDRCPVHPNLELEIIEEENYFFRFSKYAPKLLEFYDKNPKFVLSQSKFNELKKFAESGLNDFSVSRLKEKMPWGVPVPGDEKHVIYVWFDGFVGYISTLGWPENEKNFADFWGTREHSNAVQLGGKDQVRQQAAMWQAMLMSAGLPNSKQIIIHGFITSDGEKMSKSLGNVIDPYEVVQKYGVDAFRYWLMRELNTFEDGDFSEVKFKERYNADLANGLGNLVSRILKMAADWEAPQIFDSQIDERRRNYTKDENLENYNFQESIKSIWDKIAELDSYIQKEEPFKKIKTDKEGARKNIKFLLYELNEIAIILQPFMPQTAAEIFERFNSTHVVSVMKPLFARSN